jgi:hypothetical protein
MSTFTRGDNYPYDERVGYGWDWEADFESAVAFAIKK